jgi:hypothetical protein
VTEAIDDTIQVKRRIIEMLRPSLLDNLGIGAALKWQCAQFSKRWNIPCRVELHDESLRLSPAHSIAFYRVVQESLTNIAYALKTSVSLLRNGERRILRIADDGVGIDIRGITPPTARIIRGMPGRWAASSPSRGIRAAPWWRPGRSKLNPWLDCPASSESSACEATLPLRLPALMRAFGATSSAGVPRQRARLQPGRCQDRPASAGAAYVAQA